MYDVYLRSPLPERLTLLLNRIDQAEHVRTDSVDPVDHRTSVRFEVRHTLQHARRELRIRDTVNL
jgi:hypothetical protein